MSPISMNGIKNLYVRFIRNTSGALVRLGS